MTAYDHEYTEARFAEAALREWDRQCYEHHWVPNGGGGGVCATCGETVDREDF